MEKVLGIISMAGDRREIPMSWREYKNFYHGHMLSGVFLECVISVWKQRMEKRIAYAEYLLDLYNAEMDFRLN